MVFGRILAKNPLGVSAEIFDIFQLNPDDLFKNYDYDKLSILFITILDAHSLFQAKLDTEWRIIAKDTNYHNHNFLNKIIRIELKDIKYLCRYT